MRRALPVAILVLASWVETPAANLELDGAIERLEESRDLHVRLRAASKIGEIGDPKGIAVLATALRSITEDPRDDWFVRRAAAAALLRLGPGSVEPLRVLVVDPQEAVRLEAIQVLVRLGAEGLGPVLAERLERDPSVAVRSTCIAGLLALRPDGTAEAIGKAAEADRSPLVRERAAWALVELGTPPPGKPGD